MDDVTYHIIDKKINSCNYFQVVMIYNGQFDPLEDQYIYKTRSEAIKSKIAKEKGVK
ncbi:MAG: hypothetical protein O2784_07340 [Proteobacteria bacterium]|nr:hypothetical protein [Pseudomonadota bacterium]